MILHGGEIGNISKKQEDQLLQMKNLYEYLNSQINVISRKDMDRFYVHHVLHSLAITRIFKFRDRSSILDLGCGGGFPGIPLAIYFPNVHFYLADSIGKKIKVVNEVVKALKLENVTSWHTRAEDIKEKQFDGVVSRAVAPLKELWKWTTPLLHQKKSRNSYGLICLKGGDLRREINELHHPVRCWEIYNKIYEDEWFKEKYILQVK